MNTYVLTITENQAMLIAQAMDLVSRVQIGKWHEFIDWLPPTKDFCHHSLREKLHPAMAEHFRKTKPEDCQFPIDGWASHYGILSEYIPDTARIAWDLKKVIEQRLSWDKNPEGGASVDFYGPRHLGSEPLAIMKLVDDELMR